MERKRKQPTPHFKLPPPFQPMTGERAPLQVSGIHPYCAMMQVAAEDTIEDYVVCRGFDTRIQKFIDYEEGNPNKPGIKVAKPYGNRVKCYYQVGQVYPAVLALQTTNPSPASVPWRVGQNPGVAEGCAGQPLSLDTEITELYDESNEKVLNWLLLDSGPLLRWVVLQGDLCECESAGALVVKTDGSGTYCETESGNGLACESLTVTDTFGAVAGSALAEEQSEGSQGSGGNCIPSGLYALVIRMMDPSAADPAACLWVPITFGIGCCESSSASIPSESSSSESLSSQSSSSAAQCCGKLSVVLGGITAGATDGCDDFNDEWCAESMVSNFTDPEAEFGCFWQSDCRGSDCPGHSRVYMKAEWHIAVWDGEDPIADGVDGDTQGRLVITIHDCVTDALIAKWLVDGVSMNDMAAGNIIAPHDMNDFLPGLWGESTATIGCDPTCEDSSEESSVSECILCFNDVCLEDVPEGTIQYAIGIDADGCLVKEVLVDCPSASPSASPSATPSSSPSAT